MADLRPAAEELRVLMLEDVQSDAELVEHELRKEIPVCRTVHVDTREEFSAALQDFKPHLILSDHKLATFTGMDALRLVRERQPDTPFIFVTGSLDEETAVECIKAGAWDYVLKDRLARLGAAVRAALELKRTRDDLQRSREQLLHAQKLEGIGRLAGGVAHDFNNLTTAILGYCALLMQSLPDDDPRQEDLQEIRDAAERATNLTSQLLAFSRRQVVPAQPVVLNDVVANMERLLRRLIGEDVKLDTDLAADSAWVHSSVSLIEQVIVNLAVNARDAMPDGGTLRIATRRTTVAAGQPLAVAGLRPGPFVVLTVHDTGIGMDADVRAHIFEPFFTTKEPGKGTGLGLATVYGIVRQGGGLIDVRSAPGAGTTFDVYLPEVPAPTHAADPMPRSAAVLVGTETILVVEDDTRVRGLTQHLLTSFGYTVLEARDGRDAMVQLESCGGKIDLLLTDVVMPGISGTELADRVTQRWPGLRVLYFSGYPDTASHGPLQRPGARLLAKPFTPEALARAVREVLDARPS